MNKLAEFILAEKTKRDMSWREFADAIGSTHPTVRSYLRRERKPDWDFLVQLARGCKVDIATVAALAAPDEAHELSAEGRLVGQRFDNLHPTFQKLFLSILSDSEALTFESEENINQESSGRRRKSVKSTRNIKR